MGLLTTIYCLLFTDHRLPSTAYDQASNAANTFGGDIGKSVKRLPVAA